VSLALASKFLTSGPPEGPKIIIRFKYSFPSVSFFLSLYLGLITGQVRDSQPFWLTRVLSALYMHIGLDQRRQWHPTPVLLPGKSHGQRSLVGCSPWGLEESDTTERLHFHFIFMHWRRKWQPTPVFLPGESQGRQSLVGRHLWGRTELDTTEAT